MKFSEVVAKMTPEEQRKQVEDDIKRSNGELLKYETTFQTKTVVDKDGKEHLLHRIRALTYVVDKDDNVLVAPGDLGGWVENEDNLSQDGLCWIADDAQVYGDAVVMEDGNVFGQATVCGSAVVGNKGIVGMDAVVEDHARVMSGQVIENAKVSGEAYIDGGMIAGNNYQWQR